MTHSQRLKFHVLPGLDNFHKAGQWAEAMIGVSTAAIFGRNAIRRICKREGKRFAKREGKRFAGSIGPKSG